MVGALAVATIAVGAALLEPSARAPEASSAGPHGAVPTVVPVGIAGESAVARDPSVPSASSVFERSRAEIEEPPVAF
jgi:hypothetical protein